MIQPAQGAQMRGPRPRPVFGNRECAQPRKGMPIQVAQQQQELTTFFFVIWIDLVGSCCSEFAE